MKKKLSVKMPKMTVVRGKLVEITDPAEVAELDRRFRAAIRAVEGEEVPKRRPRSRQAK
jgi:hypothetical protein